MSVLSLRSVALFAFTGLAVACSSSSQGEKVGTTEQRAIVTQEQADRAFKIAEGIDYLPWGYTADGCYARALYMSMELAVERIPSSNQYIYATGDGALMPVNGPTWGWHVAPMVKVTAEGTPMIIDPSLFSAPEVARSLDAWVTRNNPTPAKSYGLALVQGSHYWQIGHLVDTAPIASFAELDAFEGKDIESACGVAWDYLAKEEPTPSADALATKRGKLIDRTKSLITGLHAVEKLSDLDADKLSCGGHADGTADKKPAADDKTDAPAEPPADVPATPPAAGDDDDTKP
jgi:hypothetical protein